MASRRRIFFDTNIPSKLLADPYLPRINDIRHEIERHYRVVFSPETFIELMDTLKGGDGSFFRFDKDRMRVAAGKGTVQFMHFPGEFALQRSLSIARPAHFGPDDFKRWYKLIQRAAFRAELFELGVVRGKYESIFAPNMIVTQQNEGKESYREWLQKAVSGCYSFPPAERWATTFAKELGCDITADQPRTLAADLSAAYEFRKYDFNAAAANKSYRWDKKDSDWVDGQQLIYLADPELYFLTEETKIRTKCAASPQSSRVLILADFVRNQLGIEL